MNKNFMKVIFSELVRIGTAPFRVLPIKKNRILFTGLTGGRSYDYSCNPKYLYEYLRDHYPGQYEYVWAVKDKAQYSFLEEEGVKLVKHFTVSSFPMLLTSKIVVTNAVPGGDATKYEVYVNEQKVDEGETYPGDIYVNVPADAVGDNDNLNLVFKILNPKRPIDVNPEIYDSRLLGMAISSITLYGVAVDEVEETEDVER